ncbi:hypothetical protein SO802_003673 [Lithocarpus litseifolius]|uniref:Uncharacterized protein n=1 Tax=Lithocarpus litseifolius TaxID=425828 RepID=A0AAW2E2P9_9ROSI
MSSSFPNRNSFISWVRNCQLKFGEILKLGRRVSVPSSFSFLPSSEVMSSHIQKLVQKARVQEFKNSDELCGYYMERFDLLRKWMTKHHPNLDLSGLVIGDVEKELLSDRPSKATAKNVMEEATTIAEVIEEATPIILADPTPDGQ